MQVQGTYILDLPTRKVWDHILNRAILEEVTPGVTQLVELHPNEYQAVSQIKLGPVQGAFKGQLAVRDIVEGKSFILTLSQNSNIGSAQADIRVALQEKNGRTEVIYNGDANLTGVIGRLGQRVLGGVVNSLAKQFFSNFENKVKEIEH